MTEVKDRIVVDEKLLKESVVTVGRYTLVTVENQDGKKGHGISRCSEKDEYRPNTGNQVARGRAIKSLTNKLNGVHNRAWYLG